MRDKKHISKLPNSPLKEVIFEILLEEEVDANGNPTEEKFDLAHGIFNSKIKSKFPIRRHFQNPPNIKIFPRVSYQFWKGERIWPVIQIGPGILSVHDTDDNYEWSKFHSLISKTLNVFEESYGENLNVNRVSLRYIDALEMKDTSFLEKLKFINQNFRTTIENDFQIPNGTLVGLNLNQIFKMKDDSLVNYVISNGKSNNNNPAIVWQNQITNSKLKSKDEILNWIEEGHQILSDLFKNTIKSKFYDTFK